MITRTTGLAVPIAALAVLLGVISCGTKDQPASTPHRLTVVTSTDVWASVVRFVAGDAVEVKAIIHDPSADPHAYESTPADAAAVLKADLIVFNGGGYDDFMTKILQQAGPKPAIEAFALAQPAPGTASATGRQPHPNEHVWYDLPTVQRVAEHVAEELGKLDPGRADRFTADAKTFTTRLDDLNAKVAAIARTRAGTPVAMTEPVSFYLVEAAKLTDLTPPKFVEAVEEETDPPAGAVAATRDLLRQRQVRVLIYNPQAETPVTSQIRSDAQAAGLPVVLMTETLPDRTDYLRWMSGQIDALAGALR